MARGSSSNWKRCFVPLHSDVSMKKIVEFEDGFWKVAKLKSKFFIRKKRECLSSDRSHFELARARSGYLLADTYKIKLHGRRAKELQILLKILLSLLHWLFKTKTIWNRSFDPIHSHIHKRTHTIKVGDFVYWLLTARQLPFI